MNAAIGRIIGPQLQANTAFSCFPFPFNGCWILEFAWWLFFYWRKKIELPWGSFTRLPYGIGFSLFQIIPFIIIHTFKEKENSFHTQANNDVGGRELNNKKPSHLLLLPASQQLRSRPAILSFHAFPSVWWRPAPDTALPRILSQHIRGLLSPRQSWNDACQ